MQRLLNISARDVDYLRGEPYSTTQEQAMRERMQSRVRNVYDQARQRVIDTLGAQQGFSGVLASTLQRLNEAEAAELSGIDRDLMVKAADEMRSRLAESRAIVGGLEALERQRMMESLGLGQMIDESQRARLLDLMAALGLAPPLATAGQAGASLMGYAGQLGQLASLMGQQNLAGLTTLWDLINKMGLVPKP